MGKKSLLKGRFAAFDSTKLVDVGEYLLAVTNREGYFIFLNKPWEALLGYSRRYLMSKPVTDFMYEEDRTKSLEARRALSHKKEIKHFTNRYVHKNGTLISIEWSLRQDGNYNYCIGRDVTEQNKRDHLHNEMQKMGQIGWWMLDVRKKTVVWSDEVYRIHGLEPQGTGQPILKAVKFYPGEAEKTIQNALKTSIQNASSYDLELPFISMDRKNKWVRTKGYPILDKNGKVIQMFGVFQDITPEKEKKDKLRFYFDKMIESSQLATLGEISAGIAHEINNPLAIIQGNAERILLQLERETLSMDTVKLNAEKIIQTTTRISEIVASLKSLGRVDKEPLEKASLKTILNQAVNMISLKIKAHRVELKIAAFRKDLSVLCRPIQIEQVILNLITNSIDAIQDLRNKWIRIEVEVKDLEILIHVIDSGSGIPKEIQGKVMEPFFTTKPFGKGTGLGLSISRRIIREHGGDLFLSSKKKNTTFSICLPRQKDTV